MAKRTVVRIPPAEPHRANTSEDDRQNEIISSQSTGCSTTSEEMRLPFTLAALGRKLNEEKVNECHRGVTKFVDVTKAAFTADGWTSLAQDHYLTVTLHYTRQGTTVGKVLKTKAVYEAQTGDAVAEEVEAIQKEFEVREKGVAATVDNAANMDVAMKKMQIENVQNFLEEATVMDPRFKLKIDSDAIWDRLRSAAIVEATPRETEKQSQQEDNIQSLGQYQEVEEKQQEEVENYVSPFNHSARNLERAVCTQCDEGTCFP
ncbi:unnamed protein product [Leuciscus chuanchicus]